MVIKFKIIFFKIELLIFFSFANELLIRHLDVRERVGREK